jgi:hypothetical protein
MHKKSGHMNIILALLILAFMVWFVFSILFKLLDIIVHIIDKKKWYVDTFFAKALPCLLGDYNKDVAGL